MTRADAGKSDNRNRDLVLERLLEHYQPLLGLVSLLFRDRLFAEEVLQDTYVKLAETTVRLENPDLVDSYLRSVVFNAARSRLRGRIKPLALRAPSVLLPEEAALLAEEHREVVKALVSLPRRQRQCLALRFYEDLTDIEIARTIGISVGAVKRHIHRGMRALARKLEVRT